uniref:Uncharacterized protein n=1 Tax=Caenorhabditis japonica TaxID=281687 RepID=A0A8R1E813_CAEJA
MYLELRCFSDDAETWNKHWNNYDREQSLINPDCRNKNNATFGWCHHTVGLKQDIVLSNELRHENAKLRPLIRTRPLKHSAN